MFFPTIEEQVASRATHALWKGTEHLLHYGIPVAMTAYSTAFHSKPQPRTPASKWQQLWQSPVIQGAIKFILPLISSNLVKPFIQKFFWDPLQPIVHNLIQPSLAKVIPWVSETLQLALVTENNPSLWDSWTSQLPTWLGGPTPQLGEQLAGQLGTAIATLGQESIALTRDTLWSTAQLGECLTHGPQYSATCVSQAYHYFNQRYAYIGQALYPGLEVTANWANWTTQQAERGVKYACNVAMDTSIDVLWQGAQSISAKTRSPVHLAFYGEIALLSAAMSFWTYRNYIQVNVQNNNHNQQTVLLQYPQNHESLDAANTALIEPNERQSLARRYST
jgi:hypothetical protein